MSITDVIVVGLKITQMDFTHMEITQMDITHMKITQKDIEYIPEGHNIHHYGKQCNVHQCDPQIDFDSA